MITFAYYTIWIENASQFFVFFEPFINSIFSFKNYQRFYKMLEDRENIEKIIEELEKFKEKK